jgi:predicted ABC-type ATPase
MPRIHIIAGPPGAGKTTFAKEYLPQEGACKNFIDADLIANGLSPFAPERMAMRASKLMQMTIQDMLRLRETFGFETTLRSRDYASLIPDWRDKGYVVQLVYLSLPSWEVAQHRVNERARQGGMHMGRDVVQRRFETGLHNFHTVYKGVVDLWVQFDNGGPVPKLVDWSGA